jgi:hypothetical protein
MSPSVAGVWWSVDYEYSAADLIARLTSPTPGSTLRSDPVTFYWSAGGVGVQQYSLWFGTAPGGSQYGAPVADPPPTSYENRAPSTGGTVYVRLWTRFGAGDWQYVDYTCTAPNLTAVLSSLTPGSTLAASESATFKWNSISGATEDVVNIGNAPGTLDLGYYAVGTNTSCDATGLPVDGRTLHVRLYTSINKWRWQDNIYSAPNLVSQMTSPTPGSTLGSGTVTFNWAPATGVTAKELRIGSTLGGLDLVYEPDLGTSSSFEVELPVDGSTMYARLHACVGRAWRYQDYTYAALDLIAHLTTPTPGSTLVGSSATFEWNAIAGATAHSLYFGSTPGGQDIGVVYPEDASYEATGLPIDGRPLYVRLFTFQGEVWRYRDYTYTAALIFAGTAALAAAQATIEVDGATLRR